MPLDQRRQAIKSASPCRGRRPRHPGRRAAASCGRRRRRPRVVRPAPPGPGQRRTPLLGSGHPVPGHDTAALRHHPMYRENLELPQLPALDPHLGSGCLATIFSGATRLDHTSHAQPALFAVSYALGKTLLQSGIQVAFGIGHSVGNERGLPGRCVYGRRRRKTHHGQRAVDGRVAFRWGNARGRPRR